MVGGDAVSETAGGAAASRTAEANGRLLNVEYFNVENHRSPLHPEAPPHPADRDHLTTGQTRGRRNGIGAADRGEAGGVRNRQPR
ncbi:hypothetical protein Arub01_34230 [Actinomadura rubrobrunea]|uniref:Uncharacterized protein n=1 Tax=Actinomadura rubrobrunea TaxID=115335 RepID=A0A9W6UVL2_9ACTN|nr:hypothetical protein Arub01_34230 [Actinomadura rubrobrunea]